MYRLQTALILTLPSVTIHLVGHFMVIFVFTFRFGSIKTPFKRFRTSIRKKIQKRRHFRCLPQHEQRNFGLFIEWRINGHRLHRPRTHQRSNLPNSVITSLRRVHDQGRTRNSINVPKHVKILNDISCI